MSYPAQRLFLQMIHALRQGHTVIFSSVGTGRSKETQTRFKIDQHRVDQGTERLSFLLQCMVQGPTSQATSLWDTCEWTLDDLFVECHLAVEEGLLPVLPDVHGDDPVVDALSFLIQAPKRSRVLCGYTLHSVERTEEGPCVALWEQSFTQPTPMIRHLLHTEDILLLGLSYPLS